MWNIDSGDGNRIAQGIQCEVVARREAQAMADRLKQSVYLYDTSDVDKDGSPNEAEEFTPEATEDGR